MEEKYAINLAMADAILGIVICGVVMMYPLFDGQNGFKVNFRLELILLIPYLVKLVNLKAKWTAASDY